MVGILRVGGSQPEPWVLNSRQMDNLARVMDAAAEVKLMVMPTFFIGSRWHLLVAQWALTSRPRSTPALVMVGGNYSDRQPAASSTTLCSGRSCSAQGIVSTFASHPIYGWDLSNELDSAKPTELPWGCSGAIC